MRHIINILVLVISLILEYLFLKNTEYFIWAASGSILLFTIILSLGILFLKFQYFLPATVRLKSNKVLLTFDDGPNPDVTSQILDILKAKNCGALFFVIGTKMEQHPELIRRILDEGHQIGNHTESHNIFFAMASKKTVSSELSMMQKRLSDIGQYTVYFRPPIGYTNPIIAKVVRQLNLKTIGWTLRSYDTVYKIPEQLQTRLIQNTKPGSIVLMHDNLAVNIDALPEYIDTCLRNGIIFVKPNEIQDEV